MSVRLGTAGVLGSTEAERNPGRARRSQNGRRGPENLTILAKFYRIGQGHDPARLSRTQSPWPKTGWLYVRVML